MYARFSWSRFFKKGGFCKLDAQGAGLLSREGFVSSLLGEHALLAGRVLYRADGYRDVIWIVRSHLKDK